MDSMFTTHNSIRIVYAYIHSYGSLGTGGGGNPGGGPPMFGSGTPGKQTGQRINHRYKEAL